MKVPGTDEFLDKENCTLGRFPAKNYKRAVYSPTIIARFYFDSVLVWTIAIFPGGDSFVLFNWLLGEVLRLEIAEILYFWGCEIVFYFRCSFEGFDESVTVDSS